MNLALKTLGVLFAAAAAAGSAHAACAAKDPSAAARDLERAKFFDQSRERLSARDKASFNDAFAKAGAKNLHELHDGLRLTPKQEKAWLAFMKSTPDFGRNRPEPVVGSPTMDGRVRADLHQRRVEASVRDLARLEKAQIRFVSKLDAGQRAAFDRASDQAPFLGTTAR